MRRRGFLQFVAGFVIIPALDWTFKGDWREAHTPLDPPLGWLWEKVDCTHEDFAAATGWEIPLDLRKNPWTCRDIQAGLLMDGQAHVVSVYSDSEYVTYIRRVPVFTLHKEVPHGQLEGLDCSSHPAARCLRIGLSGPEAGE